MTKLRLVFRSKIYHPWPGFSRKQRKPDVTNCLKYKRDRFGIGMLKTSYNLKARPNTVPP